MLTYLTRRYGFRGTALVGCGVVWLVFGVGVFFMDPPTRHGVAFDLLPHWLDAAGWWATGLVAFAQGLQGPDHDDSPGHAALALMPITRVVSFGFSYLLYLGGLVFGGQAGYSQGWYSAAVWGLILFLLTLVARHPNPRVVIPRPPREV